MLTAKEAADLLGVERRTVYDLAAPHGPIPCYRMGKRCIRFTEEDVAEYLQACRHTTMTPTISGDIGSTKLFTVSVSASENCFQKRGLGRRQKLSSKLAASVSKA